jgi:protein MpaA
LEIGRTVRNKSIKAVVFEGGNGCVLILGGIHGDEPASARLVTQLVSHLENHPEDGAGRRVVLIPRANPDGLAAGTRANAHGVDLNRNFPTDNFKPCSRYGRAPLSEPEAQALAAAIARYSPSCVVSVHGPLNCIDADGGAASDRLARAMAAVSPLAIRDLPCLPGSLGTYCGRKLGLKMITYELDRKRAPNARYLTPHIRPLLVAIRRG